MCSFQSCFNLCLGPTITLLFVILLCKSDLSLKFWYFCSHIYERGFDTAVRYCSFSTTQHPLVTVFIFRRWGAKWGVRMNPVLLLGWSVVFVRIYCDWLVFDVYTGIYSIYYGDHSWYCLCKKAVFPYDVLTPACRTHCWACGRAAVRILLPPSSSSGAHSSPSDWWKPAGRELGSWDLSSSDGPANSTNLPPLYRPSRLPKILRPLLWSRLRGCGEIRTNPRTLLPHFNKSHLPQIFRKHSTEGIGVRMAAYKLVLIRHGESCWNQENRFCGWFDADLSETGEHEAKRGGQALKGTR